MADLIQTQPYTSSSADNRGFQQAAKVLNPVPAIDFGNGLTMTLSACLSHLVNSGLISFSEKKNVASQSILKQFALILNFENTFLNLTK